MQEHRGNLEKILTRIWALLILEKKKYNKRIDGVVIRAIMEIRLTEEQWIKHAAAAISLVTIQIKTIRYRTKQNHHDKTAVLVVVTTGATIAKSSIHITAQKQQENIYYYYIK